MSNKKLTIALILIIVVVGLRFFDVGQWLNIENILSNKEHLIEIANQYLFLSILIFTSTFVLLGTLGIPVYTVFAIGSGLLFGFVPGIILSLIASTCSGFLSFTISRYVLADYFRKKYGKRIQKAEAKFDKNATLYLLSLRLLPGFPYSLTNVMAGLSKIKNHSFLMATVVGIIPSITLLVYVGSLLQTMDQIRDIITFKYLWPIAIVIVMFVIAIVVKIKRSKTE